MAKFKPGESGNPNGRPSTYSDENILKVDEYLILCIQNDKLPTRAGFALYLGVSKEKLWDWGKKHDLFSSALKKLDETQEQQLLDKSLKGEYNSTIAKLVLSSNHGYAEKKEVKETINHNTALSDEDLDKRITNLLEELAEDNGQQARVIN